MLLVKQNSINGFHIIVLLMHCKINQLLLSDLSIKIEDTISTVIAKSTFRTTNLCSL